jgi:hypothetical protein
MKDATLARGLHLGWILLALGAALPAQIPSTPPPRPRLLFRATDVPLLAAKVTASGTRSAWAFGQMSTSATWQCSTTGGGCPGTGNEAWRTERSLRAMVELGARYALLGDTGAGQNARTLLLGGSWNALNYLVPTGGTPYQTATYPCAIAAAYDLIHPLLSASERAAVISRLEEWITAILAGSSAVGAFSQFGGACDNFSFAWPTGLVFCLLGIWGESSRPNIPAEVSHWLDFIRDGYLDAISPDGSIDESYGYANYGQLYSMQAMIAGQNCGFGDRIAGTNILHTGKWYARSLLGDSFPWIGDSSPTHKGMRVDPILYAALARAQDGEGLWGLDRIQVYAPVNANLTTWAWSPFLTMALHYPEGLRPVPPAEPSGFFRDNRNIAPTGSASWNKLNNNSGLGTGGLAYLHNSHQVGELLSALYIVRDEWVNHGHEDDGHLVIASGGRQQVIDRGYAAQGGSYSGAQHLDHNIVVAQGGPAYATTNYYTPPAPEGRHHGNARSVLLSPVLDYVAGDHRVAWQMAKSDRTVVLVRDPLLPYLIVCDEVQRFATGTQNVTYEQLWHGSAAATGAGTAANPFTITRNGMPLRSVYLSPGSFSVVSGTAATQSGSNIVYHANKVVASSTAQLTFLSVLAGAAFGTVQPAVAPSANARGATLTGAGFRDQFLVSLDGLVAQDSDLWLDGEFAWVRRSQATLQLASYAVGEARRLIVQGLGLLSASEPVSVSVGGGEIRIARSRGASASTVPTVACYLPASFLLQRVLLDGQPVPHVQVGNLIYVGPAPTLSGLPSLPPPPLTEDRFYTFAGGELLDAEMVPGLTLSAAGAIQAQPGGAVFAPRGGLSWRNGPLLFAADLGAAPGATGPIATWRIGTTPGGTELASVEVHPDAAGARARVATPAGVIGEWTVQRLGTETLARVRVEYRPATGNLLLTRRDGTSVAATSVTATAGSYHVRLWLSGGASADNIAFFDAAEDKTTPQGLAAWMGPQGLFGWAICAPGLQQSLALDLYVGGAAIPPPTVAAWLVGSAYGETLVAPYVPAGSPIPGSLREIAFEAGLPSVLSIPGIAYTVVATAGQGHVLAGGAWIPPSP